MTRRVTVVSADAVTLAAVDDEPDLISDLNQEDDDANNWTIVETDDFDPSRIYPGACVTAGHPGGRARVQVIRTELLRSTRHDDICVLVTFYQLGLKTLPEALNA